MATIGTAYYVGYFTVSLFVNKSLRSLGYRALYRRTPLIWYGLNLAVLVLLEMTTYSLAQELIAVFVIIFLSLIIVWLNFAVLGILLKRPRTVI